MGSFDAVYTAVIMGLIPSGETTEKHAYRGHRNLEQDKQVWKMIGGMDE